MVSVIVNILLFILVIGILTFVHELGHFLAAKAIGATVEEFSLGFGPKLFSKKIKGTLYCIRILPLGGFVKILGDGDPEDPKEKEKVKKSDGSLRNKPRWAQAIVMAAGVTMNIIFAIVVYTIFLAYSGWKLTLDWSYEGFNPTGAKIEKEIVNDVTYTEVISGGNAEKAGIPAEGIIKSINGQVLVYATEIGEILGENKGKSVIMNICVGSECKDYTVDVSDEGKIGIGYPTNYYVILSYEDDKVFSGVNHLVNTLRLIVIRFGEMFSEAKTTGDYTELSNSVSGPVGIYFLIDYFKNFGFVAFISVMGDLSLSLAVMNLLPIPALDGGRIFILAIEGILRKDLNEKVKTMIINISFIFLMVLVIFIMIKDVLNIQNIKDMFK